MGRLVAGMVLVSGCYSPSFQPGAPCDTDRDCPSSLRCVERVCGGTASMTMEDAAIDAPPDVAIDAPKPPMTVMYSITSANQMRDVWIWSANPTSTLGADVQGSVDAQDNESTLFWFDLSQIPTNASVTSATFRIKTDDTNDPDGGTAIAYVMLEPWVENEASFLRRNTNQTWSTSGARPPSRATTVIGTLNPAAVQTFYDVTLQPAAVQAWVTTPGSNYGFILVRGTSVRHLHFHMKESSAPPSLKVTALVPQS